MRSQNSDIFWGPNKPITILTDNKSVTTFFQTKIIPPALWYACDYVIQFTFVIAHIPGKNNTAADYLSRIEMDPKEKVIPKILEDIETKLIEVNIQSTGVAEQEQVFFTEHDDETEEQIRERKQQSRNNLIDQEVVIQIDTISENIVDEITKITRQLKAKIQN